MKHMAFVIALAGCALPAGSAALAAGINALGCYTLCTSRVGKKG